jgi:hypothetical protein
MMASIIRCALCIALITALPALARQGTVVGLDFEGMQLADNTGVYQAARVHRFYALGHSQTDTDPPQDLVLGSSDFDVDFNDDALVFRSIDQGSGTGNFGPRFLGSQGGALLTGLGVAALGFRDDPVLNYARGFAVGLSFYYASATSITVTLYSGLNGAGNVLGTGSFGETDSCSLVNNTFCAWSIGAIDIAGRPDARSVRFTGAAESALFDNVTFGSVTPVPESGSLMMMALGMAAIGARSLRKAH